MKILNKYIFISLLMLFLADFATAQQEFTSLDSLLSYANQKNTTLKSGEIRLSQAQKSKLYAIAGIADITGNISLNATNNTHLPVNLFPAEAFGGTPGTYKEVQTGIQYTNNFNLYGEIKLLNASGWQNLKLAKINIDVTTTDNKLSRKTLYENIAVTYYNILTLQEQIKSTNENIKSADTLYQIVKNKFELGLARQQDLNDAQVNYINIKESAAQIEYMIQQQYIALKILCDIPESENIRISQLVTFSENTIKPNITFNQLNLIGSQFKEKSALTSYRQLKFTTLPYISAFASNSNQQFSNDFSLFDNNVHWKNSNYIGFKIAWLIPTANSITQISKAKYDYLLAKQNTEHQQLKTNLDFQQLSIDFEKSQSQMNSNKKIYELQTETYNKNLENYKQGVLGLDQLLNSYNAMVSSNYNYISSAINVLLTQSRIYINNKIK